MQRILRRPEVERMTGLKKTQLDALEREGKFPGRRRLSARATGWLLTEVEAWIEERPLASVVDADAGDQLRSLPAADRRRGAHQRSLNSRPFNDSLETPTEKALIRRS